MILLQSQTTLTCKLSWKPSRGSTLAISIITLLSRLCQYRHYNRCLSQTWSILLSYICFTQCKWWPQLHLLGLQVSEGLRCGPVPQEIWTVRSFVVHCSILNSLFYFSSCILLTSISVIDSVVYILFVPSEWTIAYRDSHAAEHHHWAPHAAWSGRQALLKALSSIDYMYLAFWSLGLCIFCFSQAKKNQLDNAAVKPSLFLP